jgi:lipid-A-disaccharide synthase-like uncharacterized protein
MTRGRIRASELVAGAGGALLLASLFLPWFDEESAWQSLGVADIVLCLAAAVAIWLPLAAAASEKTDVPIVVSALTALGGVLGLLLVVFRLLDPVGSAGRDIGLYLALAASILVAAGGWRAMASET